MSVTKRITRTQRHPARHWATSRTRVAAVSGRLQASRCGCADCARCAAWAQASGRRRKTGSGKAGPRGKPRDKLGGTLSGFWFFWVDGAAGFAVCRFGTGRL